MVRSHHDPLYSFVHFKEVAMQLRFHRIRPNHGPKQVKNIKDIKAGRTYVRHDGFGASKIRVLNIPARTEDRDWDIPIIGVISKEGEPEEWSIPNSIYASSYGLIPDPETNLWSENWIEEI
jgi:hypothetical protein